MKKITLFAIMIVLAASGGWAKDDKGSGGEGSGIRGTIVAVGDSLTDVRTAGNAGTQFAAVLTGPTSRDTFDDDIILLPDLSHLTAHLLTLT